MSIGQLRSEARTNRDMAEGARALVRAHVSDTRIDVIRTIEDGPGRPEPTRSPAMPQ